MKKRNTNYINRNKNYSNSNKAKLKIFSNVRG